MISTPSPLRAALSGFRDPVVLALGLTQTLGYGTLFYAWGVVAPDVARDFGVSIDIFFAVFTIGLVSTGLFAPLVGRWLDRFGARRVMGAGAPIAALAMLACALSPNLWTFGAAIILMEFAGCMMLYEAAFAGLVQTHGHAARSRISAVTFVAGFASTIFWPLTFALSEAFGWRATFVIYAASLVLVCLPLHLLVLPRGARRDEAAPRVGMNETPPVFAGAARRRAIILYAASMIVSGIVIGALPIHMLGVLEAQGLAAATAAFVAMAVGPAQVAARLVDVLASGRFSAIATGYAAFIALAASFAILLLVGGSLASALVFAAVYGASQGLMTIARGTVPLHLFGTVGYATLNGRINGIRFLVNAAAPFAFSLLATRLTMDWALAACLACAVVSLLCFAAIGRPAKPA